MDFQEYGISSEAQARIDGAFLGQVTERLNANLDTGYFVLPPDTRDEIEAVYIRTHTGMHEAVMDGRDIAEQTLANLGSLSFIDTLGIASNRGARNKKDPATVWLDKYLYFRLFKGLLSE